MAEDNIQHGIDDNPHHDAEKGAALGGIGGAAVGAIAGSAVGPVGAIVGAVVGGLAGAGASGAAVAAVDEVDNDNSVSGLGNGATTDIASPSVADASAANHPDASNPVRSTIGSADIVGHATNHTHANATETGTASANAVFPSPSTGHEGISRGDVSDMNIDSQDIENRDVVPNVRYDDNPAASDNTNMGTAGLGAGTGLDTTGVGTTSMGTTHGSGGGMGGDVVSGGSLPGAGLGTGVDSGTSINDNLLGNASPNTLDAPRGFGDDVGNTSDVAVGRTPSTGIGTDTSGLGSGIGNDLPGVQIGGSNPVPDNRGLSDQNSDISSGNAGHNSGGQSHGQA